MISFLSQAGSATYGPTNPRQRALTAALLDMIVSCGLPISLVDDEDFRAFVAKLDLKFTLPCRQTVTYTLLPQLKVALQAKLQALLDSCYDIALTTDIWTDRRSHSFLAVTAHVFTNGCTKSVLLSFKSFKGSHTGQKIADALETIIAEFGVQTKIRAVVTDNASNMRKALSVLIEAQEVSLNDDGDFVDDASLWEDTSSTEIDAVVGDNVEHIACFAHSLQLVVRDGLTCVNSARSLLAKCCKMANLLHQSALFRSSFEAAMGPGKIIPSSNETRWNSTFRQLQVIEQIEHAKLSSFLRDADHENLVLTVKEFGQLQELVNILAPFAEATDLTQGDKTITISCVIPTILSLSRKLECFLLQPSSFTPLLKTLLQGIRDRFAGIFTLLSISHPNIKRSHCNDLHFDSNLFLMASALDPMYAYQWLQDHPGSDEEKEEIRCKINGDLLFYMHCDYDNAGFS